MEHIFCRYFSGLVVTTFLIVVVVVGGGGGGGGGGDFVNFREPTFCK